MFSIPFGVKRSVALVLPHDFIIVMDGCGFHLGYSKKWQIKARLNQAKVL